MIIRSVFTACFICFHIFTNAQTNIDVQHYKFEIFLTDQSDTITGKATVLVKFIAATDQVTLDLTSVKGRKGMVITSINENNNPVEFSHQQDKIAIRLNQKPNTGETKTFIIEYKGIPSDGLIISNNKYGNRTFFADNWPNRGHNWIPCVDDPADKASVEFIVTAPQHYQVVSNGILIEQTNLTNNKKLTHWKEEVPVATKVMVIGAADFAVSLAGSIDNCIPVYSWVYPEDRDKGFYDFAQALEILPFFIKNVGPYGYKKLASVQSKTTFGGLENANTIFYAENTVTGTRDKESLLAHEIAHQWFGNMATEKSFAHIWLSEGFATYYTILYFEKKYGKDTADYMLKEDRNLVINFAKNYNRPIIDETKDYMELLNPNSYQKGSWVLHMLRRQLGDSVFHKSIKTFYAEYAGKNADTKDLQSVVEKTSGKDLSVFFQQWLYTAIIPTLNVSWKYLSNEKKVTVTVRQLQITPFVFPLEIKLKNAIGNNTIKTISVSKKEETFIIPIKEKPSLLTLDSNTSLLFTGNTIETK
ncbi:MAG: M1 family aminopeptidase [Chitinophagaceae bacterium]